MRKSIKRVYLMKALLSAGVLLGRLIYNIRPPVIGRLIPDVKYGPHRQQSLDVIVPRGMSRYPILIYVHGGGWFVGDKAIYTRICRTFSNQGYLVFNLNYRLGPRYAYPIQIQDTARAILWVFKHAQKYGGNCSTIFLAGDSAGAQLTSWYAAALQKQQLFRAVRIEEAIPREALRGLLLFYGVFDCETFAKSTFPFAKGMTECFLGSDMKTFAKRAELVSPIRHVNSGMPPCFVCAGEKDRTYPQSVAFVDALGTHGIPHTKLFFSRSEYPDAHHGFLNFYYKQCSKIAMMRALEFLYNNR